MKIGLYDSGLGGLTILKSVAASLPQYDYEYYGDTASVPLGDKSESEIYDCVKQGIGELFLRECALIIVACNTASAESLRRLQDEYIPHIYPDRRILGVIIPTVEEVVLSGCKRVLLLATKRTISSGKYHFELGKLNTQHVKIDGEATPELVPLIESGDLEAALEAAALHIEARGDDIDGVVLGCTHYSLLREGLQRRFPMLRFFSQDQIIPAKLEEYLARHDTIQQQLSTNGSRNVHLTKHSEYYDLLLPQFLDGHFMLR